MICSKGNAFLHFKRRVFFWYAGFTRDWHKAFKGLSFPTSSIPPVARKGPFHCFCSVQALWLHSPFASTHSAARNPSMKLGPPGESWELALKIEKPEVCWAELMWAVTKTPWLCLFILIILQETKWIPTDQPSVWDRAFISSYIHIYKYIYIQRERERVLFPFWSILLICSNLGSHKQAVSKKRKLHHIDMVEPLPNA